MIRLKQLLFEQATKSVVQNIYNQIVSAVKRMGTNETKLVSAINQLKSAEEYTILNTMFSDNKTGYDSFETMINEEFEDKLLGRISNKTSNYTYAMQIQKKLESIGLDVSFDSAKNRLGVQYFNGNFKVTESETEPTKPVANNNTNNTNNINTVPTVTINGVRVKSTTNENMPLQQLVINSVKEARDYFIKWIESPITKQKFINNWKPSEPDIDTKVDSIFQEYKRIISNVSLILYKKSGAFEQAKVYPSNATSAYPPIYYNIAYTNTTDIVATLVHEMQHLIYHIKPLNPDKKVQDAFVDKSTTLTTPEQLISSTNNIATKSNASGQAASILNIQETEITKWTAALRKELSQNPEYVADDTENMSRIMGIRSTFDIQPGQNITLEMLKPYITGELYDSDIYWLLCFWAYKGFRDINSVLNDLNQLAIKTNKPTNQNQTNPTNQNQTNIT